MHYSSACDKIIDLKQTKLILQHNGHCFLCIKTGHQIKECQSLHKCRNCWQSHHQSISQKSIARGKNLNSSESRSGNTPRVVQLTTELPQAKYGENMYSNSKREGPYRSFITNSHSFSSK